MSTNKRFLNFFFNEFESSGIGLPTRDFNFSFLQVHYVFSQLTALAIQFKLDLFHNFRQKR